MITTSHVIRFIVRAVQDEQAVYNILDYKPESTNPQFGSSIQQCVAAFSSFWLSNALAIQSDSLGVAEIQGIAIEGTRTNPNDPNTRLLKFGDYHSQVPGSGNFGAIVGPALPTYVAATFRKKTAKAGRSKRGSMRFGGLVEADTGTSTPNVLTTPAKTALEVFGANLLIPLAAGVAGDTLKLGVLAQTDMLRDTVPVTVASNWIEVCTAISVNSYVGSQVSRKRRSIAAGFAL